MTTTQPQPGHTISDDHGDLFQLSFAQDRIWFLEQLDPGTAAFTLSTALRARGRLDLDALRHAFADLVDRHETLRTRFVTGPDGPQQEVLRSAHVELEIVDGAGSDPVGQAIEESYRVRLDLDTAPLLRAKVTRVGIDDAVLVINVHHIICDGRSADILWRDLTSLYRQASLGVDAALPELSVQYADYAEWQRGTVDETVMSEQLDFWRAELRGTTGRCELATDRPRPTVQDNLGAFVEYDLPAARAARLLQITRQEQVSPFMIVLAAYELALTRSSGRADFCVGTSIAGRTQREVEDVLGCFLNLMPVRADTTGNPSLRQLLQQVRRRCLRAYANSDLPFERVVDDLAPDRDLARPPLFDVLLAVQRGRTSGVEVDGLSLTPEVVPTAIAHYDLALDVEIDETGVGMLVCYATSLFDEATARLFALRIDDALAAFEGDLDRRLTDVAIRAGADAPADEPAGGVGLRESRAEHHAYLVRCAERVRAAVDTLAGAGIARVSDHLHRRGIGAGDVVAVLTTDPAARLAAMFGVQSCGASALVLDAADPAAWHREVVAAHGAVTALDDLPPADQNGTPDGVADRPAAAVDINALTLVAPLPTRPPMARTWTGAAVAVAIAGVADALSGCQSVHVDATVDPVLEVVVTVAAHLAGAELAAEQVPAPSAVLFAIPPADDVAAELRHAGSRAIVLSCPCDSGVPYGATTAGHEFAPLRGVEVSRIDELGANALPGAVGEIVLSGAAPRTAGQHDSGDLVRWSDTAPPQPVSRTDGTTVRGGRCTPTSWAVAVLESLDEVEEAAVVATSSGLVAFVTPQLVDVGAARELLSSRLPAALVPATILPLARLARRRDGSLDTTALLARAVGALRDVAGDEPTLTGPRTHAERALLDCFTGALDCAGMTIYDDFFASGGTSLAAARLVGPLSDAVGVQVPLKLLFQHPSVAELAAALEGEFTGRLTALEAAAQDQHLPTDITVGATRAGPARTALLTGATGFVGSHLLAALLDRGLTRVTCLVRGTDDTHSRRRLAERLALYSLEIDWDRVDVVCGDLEQPWLGLGEDCFAQLAEDSDVVFHLGAHMNFFRPYRVLQAPNVRGTQEIVRFACTGRASTMHYVSTVDSRAGSQIEERPLAIEVGREDGYVLTKKTAEHLVLEAGRRGLPIAIYRPWQITSHQDTGAVNPLDQLALCLTGILLTGVAPSDNPLPLHILPVDQITRILAELVDTVDHDRPVRHFFNARVTPIEVVTDVVAECGYPLQKMPYSRWRVEAVRRTANQVEGLAALLANDVSDATLPDAVHTDNLSASLGYSPRWPDDDRAWVRRTIDFLVRTGVVPAPAGGLAAPTAVAPSAPLAASASRAR